MKKIAVVVEGPSDEAFWEKVLNREFARLCRFKVIKQNGRSKVISGAADLLESLRGAGYAAIFFVVDLDDEPCVTAVRKLFSEGVRTDSMLSLEQRCVHICIARRDLESWLLADEEGICATLRNVAYTCEAPTDGRVGKAHLKQLIRNDRGPGASFREPAFAQEMAPRFSPAKAARWSSSFRHFWTRMTNMVERLE